MAGENVLNFFEQADENGDNKFVMGGTSETANGTSLKTVVLQGRIPNSTTLSTFNADDSLIPIPFSGRIISVQAAIKNLPQLDDIVMEIKTSQGTVVGSEITFKATEGDFFKESIPTANNIVSAGDVFEMVFSDSNASTQGLTDLIQRVTDSNNDTVNSGIAKATTGSAHGLVTGQEIEIINASEAAYNVLFRITVESTTEFSYLVPTGALFESGGPPSVVSKPIIPINFSIVIELD